MAVEIVTKEDLHQFREQLLRELKELMRPPKKEKRWLRSFEVRTLLQVSPGTLQNLRIKRVLPFVKLGSTIYYDYEELEKLFENRGNEKSK